MQKMICIGWLLKNHHSYQNFGWECHYGDIFLLYRWLTEGGTGVVHAGMDQIIRTQITYSLQEPLKLCSGIIGPGVKKVNCWAGSQIGGGYRRSLHYMCICCSNSSSSETIQLWSWALLISLTLMCTRVLRNECNICYIVWSALQFFKKYLVKCNKIKYIRITANLLNNVMQKIYLLVSSIHGGNHGSCLGVSSSALKACLFLVIWE